MRSSLSFGKILKPIRVPREDDVIRKEGKEGKLAERVDQIAKEAGLRSLDIWSANPLLQSVADDVKIPVVAEIYKQNGKYHIVAAGESLLNIHKIWPPARCVGVTECSC